MSVFAQLRWQTLPIIPIVANVPPDRKISMRTRPMPSGARCAASARRRQSGAARSHRAYRRCQIAIRSVTSARAARICLPDRDLPRELKKTTLDEYRVEPGDGLSDPAARPRIESAPAGRSNHPGRRDDRPWQVRPTATSPAIRFRRSKSSCKQAVKKVEKERGRRLHRRAPRQSAVEGLLRDGRSHDAG